MSRTHTFGVVGGYGATGSAVAAELLQSCTGEILIGGRDLSKGDALAAKLGNRVSAAPLDVLDARSLDDFCSRCSIIINCAGPVMITKDRVAQSAFRSRSHYVDLADLNFVKQGMLAHAQTVAGLGLSFAISSGWMPGITEIVPAYAIAQAHARMETIESLNVFFGDSGEWSDNALRDAVWYLRETGLRRPSYFSKGKMQRAKMSEASRKFDLGPPVGAGRFSLVSLPEQEEMARQLIDCDVFSYSYLSGARTVAAAILVALVPLPERFAVQLVRNMFRRNHLPVDGFAVAQVLGRSQGRKSVFTAQVVYRNRRDYWINALAPATTARMIAEGNLVRTGVHYLADAVDPAVFLLQLKKAGVEHAESFTLHV